MNKLPIVIYAAATTTFIGGIIHIFLGLDTNNVNAQILFIVGGAAQVFWIVPLLRKWGIVWYSIGLGGTIVFIAIWAITRIPDNFITGRGGRISDNGIIVETFQIAFVALIIAILVMSKKSKNIEESK